MTYERLSGDHKNKNRKRIASLLALPVLGGVLLGVHSWSPESGEHKPALPTGATNFSPDLISDTQIIKGGFDVQTDESEPVETVPSCGRTYIGYAVKGTGANISLRVGAQVDVSDEGVNVTSLYGDPETAKNIHLTTEQLAGPTTVPLGGDYQLTVGMSPMGAGDNPKLYFSTTERPPEPDEFVH